MPKGKRRRQNVEIVPASFVPQHLQNQALARGPNTLRNAHRTSTSKGSTAAERKASELWFRKCGHGELLFTAYYKGLGNIVPHKEWKEFSNVMMETSLPVTFRLHGSSEGRRALEARLASLGAAFPVPWAPASVGIWQATAGIDKRSLTKGGSGSNCLDESVRSGLAEVLVEGCASGLLNRQEAVSMLPVLALQVNPGDTCLDVCASPGSKTMQLLEAVALGGSKGGLVVANDAHPKRVTTLIQSLQRHGRPAEERSKLVVTCHRGEEFPRAERPFRKAASADAADDRGSAIGFDRVLADVPCSGDGTLRKDRTVLPRWTPGVSNQLHAVQLEIGWRCLEVLRVGGRLVYSTCSLNPVEDEAVVAAMLMRANGVRPGAVTLEVWPPGVLPDLKRRPGVATWKVADHIEVSGEPSVATGGAIHATHLQEAPGGKRRKRSKGPAGGASGAAKGARRAYEYDSDVSEGADDADDADAEVRLRWHESFAAATAAGMPHAVATLWPPRQAHAAAMKLERCSRFLPHDQDTGGFFVAILCKHAPLCPVPLSAEGQQDALLPESKAAPAANGSAAIPRQAPPQEDLAEVMRPLPKDEAEDLGAQVGLKRASARRRLLRASTGAVHIAPAALSAFAPGTVNVAMAGVPVPDTDASR